MVVSDDPSGTRGGSNCWHFVTRNDNLESGHVFELGVGRFSLEGKPVGYLLLSRTRPRESSLGALDNKLLMFHFRKFSISFLFQSPESDFTLLARILFSLDIRLNCSSTEVPKTDIFAHKIQKDRYVPSRYVGIAVCAESHHLKSLWSC
eukprot:Gregarina_sp_Poly_1__1713@NODE_1441_length_4147_cov_6_703922_g956_i0_p1_GENE_NODE_1441_length_4147_cov_6_703922_g956_i0NODE_1441_length_4147_cov_6_703922_g956_i0_p1_ORF_typecomplete_len149_score11_94_NODE_1441_length_4147_cov_6_703922_g956_i033663812